MKKLILINIFFLLTSNLFGSGINRITVLEFTTSGVSESEMLLFIDYIASEITRNKNYILIDRRQRDKILDELSFSNSGCTDEECQLEIGKLLSANNIIVGSIGSLGSTYILNMQLVDIETGETTETISSRYMTLDELVNDSTKLVSHLLNSEYEPSPPVSQAMETQQPAVPAQTPSAGRERPLQITSRPGLFSKLYIYNKKLYDNMTSMPLAEIIISDISLTSETTSLFNDYKEQYNTGMGMAWGGLGVMGAGVLVELYGGLSETEPLLIGGAVVIGAGLIMEIIGGFILSGAHEKFGRLVKIYNSNL